MASWDDDDFDVEEELEKQAAAKQDEEKTIDDIEEEARKKAEAEALAAGKPKKKEKKKEEVKPEDVPYDVALSDPVAEKLRRQKLVEEADARMAADLFSGVEKAADAKESLKAKEEKARKEKEAAAAKKAATKAQIVTVDAFDKVEMKTQADVESMTETCVEKLNAAKAKGSSQKFLVEMLKALSDQLSTEDLNNFDKLITGLVKTKKVEQTSAQANKGLNKQGVNKNTKFDTGKELADVYGEGDWGDDWDEEWWDDSEYSKPPPQR